MTSPLRLDPGGPGLAVVGGDATVPLVDGREAPGINLDFAASAPALEAVREAVEAFLPWYSSVHRGAGYKSSLSTVAYESARDEVARFVAARTDDVVVFTRNTTDSLNLLSACLPDDTHVVTFDVEHHADLLPWRRHRHTHLPAPPSAGDVATCLDETLRRVAAAPQTKHVLVAVTAACNVTGELWPVADVVRVAHDHGARVVVDAAQLAPHGPVHLSAWDADWVAISGHKLYAPYGAGALVGRREWLADAPAYLAGGGAVAFVTADDVVWTGLPERHEAGSPNVVGALALAAACRVLRQAGMDAVLAAERRHEAHLRRRLEAIDGVTTYRLWSADHPRLGIVSFNVAGLHHSYVGAALSAEHGIAVRDGCFCAHPLMLRLLGVPATEAAAIRARILEGDHRAVPGAVRASAGLPTTTTELDALADAVALIASRGPEWTYEWSDSQARYVPEPDPRPWPSLPGLPALAHEHRSAACGV